MAKFEAKSTDVQVGDTIEVTAIHEHYYDDYEIGDRLKVALVERDSSDDADKAVIVTTECDQLLYNSEFKIVGRADSPETDSLEAIQNAISELLAEVSEGFSGLQRQLDEVKRERAELERKAADSGFPFKVGDIVEGNDLADELYVITTKGVQLRVTKIDAEDMEFGGRIVGGSVALSEIGNPYFFLKTSAFEKVVAEPATDFELIREARELARFDKLEKVAREFYAKFEAFPTLYGRVIDHVNAAVDGRMTRVFLFSKGVIIASASASANPDDKFSKDIGIALALSRATDRKLPKALREYLGLEVR